MSGYTACTLTSHLLHDLARNNNHVRLVISTVCFVAHYLGQKMTCSLFQKEKGLESPILTELFSDGKLISCLLNELYC